MAQLPIVVNLRHSFVWHWVLRFLHAMLLIEFLLVPWDWSVKLGLGLAVLLSYVHTEQRRFVPLRLRLGPKGLIQSQPECVQQAEQAWKGLSLVSVALIHPWLTLFAIRDDLDLKARKRWIWVLPDSCTSNDFRHLRVWLKWGAKRTQGFGQSDHLFNGLPGI